MRWAATIAGVALLGACDSGETADDASMEEERVPLSIVDPFEWTVAEEGVDAFADQRPPEIDCDPDRGMAVEETPWQTRFEINTGWCNYATVAQPILEALEPGDSVEVRVYHFELTGSPAEAYVAAALDGEIRWEQTIPIPSEGQLLKGIFEVDEAVDAGTSIQFHVHNHGVNTWELVSIERL